MTSDAPADRVGIVLAGGSGSRLFPATAAVNKQLLPVYDKPMIYYPLATLMLAGIREFVVVSQPDPLARIRAVLGDGARWGLAIDYAEQPSPDGIAHGLIVADDVVRGRPSALVLGDNVLYGSGLPRILRTAAAEPAGATIFGYPVTDPSAFGVVTLDERGRPVALEEKPRRASSNLAIPGLYFYDGEAAAIARTLKPSARGELEITDVNRVYLGRGTLRVTNLGRGIAWLDGGTPEDLFEAAQFVRVMEERTGLKIACPEEIAWRMGWIGARDLESLAAAMKPCAYRTYLERLAGEAADGRSSAAAG